MTTLPHPYPYPGLDPASVVRTRLGNGLTVLLRRDASSPVAAVVTYVKAGYFDETDDVAGIAHVLEHMFFKGTPTRGVGEIAKQTKASGGYLNAHTIYDHTSYYAVLPASGFAAGLEIQADAYANSLIDADELRRELEVIIQEARRKTDNPHALTIETLYEVLHDRHRMRRWRIGHEGPLRALTRDALHAFYVNFYRPSNTILSIVGDVDPDATMAQVERLYGGLPDSEPLRTPGPDEPDRAPALRYREWSGDIQQTQLAAGWRTPPLLHADTPLLDLVGAVLGSGRASRLYRAVRERQLASSVSAYNYTPTELGVFVIHAEASPDRAADAARATWAQLRALLDEGVGDHELERARRLYETRHLRRLETMEGQANHLAEWEALGDWTLGDRYLERMLTADAAQVTEVARRYLVPEGAGLVVYRPDGAPPFAADAAEARARLLDAPPHPLPPTPPRAAVPTPTAPAPALERVEAGVSVYRTPAGLPILVWPKPGARIAHAGVYFAGGATEEGADHAGLTKLLTRTALKGTVHRTGEQIAEDAELIGASIGGAAGHESFGWSVSVPLVHLPAALALLGDVVQHATVPDGAFETERTMALADVAQLRDDMYRHPARLAAEAAFPGHPYGVPVGGDERTLAAVTADDARRWHRERVLGGAPVLGIVGDGDPDALAALAASHFPQLAAGTAPAGAAPDWPASVVVRAEQRDKAQTALAMLFAGPRRRDDDRFAAELLAGVASGLGGRFFDELRDRQSLAYTVHAYVGERLLAGTFGAYIATGPEQEEVARDGLLLEFAKLRDTPVTDEELQRAKTYALGTHAIHRESGGSRLSEMVDAWMLGTGLGELAEYETRVSSLTAADLQAVAARYFDPERRVEGIVRGRAGKIA